MQPFQSRFVYTQNFQIMKIKFISKLYGIEFIDTETYEPIKAKTSSTIYKCVEHLFEKWFETASSEYRAMYLGEEGCPAIFKRKGAIRNGIELFIENIVETFEGRDFMILDTKFLVKYAAFQD